MRALWSAPVAGLVAVVVAVGGLATPPATSNAPLPAAEPRPVPIDPLPPTGLPELPGAEATRGTAGWNPLSPGYRWKARPTYQLVLAKTSAGDAGRLRAQFERLVLTIPNVDITVMPGTVGRTYAKAGEILVSISNHSPCDGVSWIGCGPPKAGRVWGDNPTKVEIKSARIYLKPRIFDNDYGTSQYSVLAHELGHNLGLGHYSVLYNGVRQVMDSGGDVLPEGYQLGDRNGLRSARGIEKGWRNFRTRAIEVTRFNGEDWMIGADAEGKVWARHSGSKWQDIGGVLRGAPAAIVQNGQLHLFGVGTDGDVYRNLRYGGKWHGWVEISAAPAWVGGISGIVGNGGRIHLYGRNAATRSGQQLAWTGTDWVLGDLGGILLGDIASMYLPAINAHSLWGVGTNGILYQKNWTGSWGQWQPVADSPGSLDGAVTAIRDSSGRYRLAMVKTSGKIQHASWTSTTGWRFWVRDTRARGRLALARVPGSSRIRVFAPSWEGHVRVSTQTTTGWTSFKIAGPR